MADVQSSHLFWVDETNRLDFELPIPGKGKVVRDTDKVGRPPGELGVSKPMECDIFPSVL